MKIKNKEEINQQFGPLESDVSVGTVIATEMTISTPNKNHIIEEGGFETARTDFGANDGGALTKRKFILGEKNDGDVEAGNESRSVEAGIYDSIEAAIPKEVV